MFPKDLLLIDMEATGLDVTKQEMIQIAAVLLDRKTLEEKKSFVSYIKPIHWENRNKEAMDVNNISWEMLKKAPSLGSVIKKLIAIASPEKVILSYYAGILDIEFLRESFKKTKHKFPYDYHYFNIWGLFLAYVTKHGLITNKKQYAGFGLEDLMAHFNIPVSEDSLHDALVDCRVEAEILRRALKDYQNS